MKRLIFDSKACSFIWKDWKPEIKNDFGPSCVKKSKYVSDKVRINNGEVVSGSNRKPLYTMPDGIDNGVRYSPLYESSGLDITEIEANKKVMIEAKEKVDDLVKEEIDKAVEATKEKVTAKKASSSESDSSFD